MKEQSKDNIVTFRLNDVDLEKLDALAASYESQRGTMLTNIIENVLNENMQEFAINHISYPRPIIKKLFTILEKKQRMILVPDMNKYNKGVIESTMRVFPNCKILNILKKSWKSFGCEVREITVDDRKILEIHHELERNWSEVTSSTTSYILELLDNKIIHTIVEDDWFKIEYSPNDQA